MKKIVLKLSKLFKKNTTKIIKYHQKIDEELKKKRKIDQKS